MNDKSKYILIVDDEIDLLEMYKDSIESEGINVMIASSADEALKVMALHFDKVALIISDSNMGKKSGLDLLKDLKLTYPTTPLFYLATGDVTQSLHKLNALGVNRLLIKPFELDEIVATIKIDLKL